MWNRRRFLEALSGLPFLGRMGVPALGAGAATLLPVEAAAKGGRDYFRELGVRPFINASGTYTAMTASLMPPEVMDCLLYTSPSPRDRQKSRMPSSA